MARPGLRKIYRYSDEFKATAVRLSHLPGVAVQDVAISLDIHPFMLSRWRKELRESPRVTKHTEPHPFLLTPSPNNERCHMARPGLRKICRHSNEFEAAEHRLGRKFEDHRFDLHHRDEVSR